MARRFGEPSSSDDGSVTIPTVGLCAAGLFIGGTRFPPPIDATAVKDGVIGGLRALGDALDTRHDSVLGL